MKPRGREAVLGTRPRGGLCLSLPVRIFLAYMKTLADSKPRPILWSRLFESFFSHPLADSTWGPLCSVPAGTGHRFPQQPPRCPRPGSICRFLVWECRQLPVPSPEAAACTGGWQPLAPGPGAAGGREQPVAPGVANAAHIPAGTCCPVMPERLLPGPRVQRGVCLHGAGTLHIPVPTAGSWRCLHIPARSCRFPGLPACSCLPRCCPLQFRAHSAQDPGVMPGMG